MKDDGFVKSPSAALRFAFVVAAYLVSTSHSSGVARLAYEAFYFAIRIMTFYENIKGANAQYYSFAGRLTRRKRSRENGWPAKKS
jgi:hypothetical protein